MGLIGRTVFLEIASRALLGTTIFTFVLFLRKVSQLFEQLVRGSAAPETVTLPVSRCCCLPFDLHDTRRCAGRT